MSEPAVLFIGRWQPVHRGHMALVDAGIAEHGGPALIYVRDIEPDEKNPFTTGQTMQLLAAAFSDAPYDVDIICGPDIKAICYGRGVGYKVDELVLSEDVQRISATEIRSLIKAGQMNWRDYVHPAVGDLLLELDW